LFILSSPLRKRQEPGAKRAGHDDRYPARPHRDFVAGNYDIGLGNDPQQMTETKHRENNSGDTQTKTLVSHMDIIQKTRPDFIKNQAETDAGLLAGAWGM
jgi:hypothetical protein